VVLFVQTRHGIRELRCGAYLKSVLELVRRSRRAAVVSKQRGLLAVCPWDALHSNSASSATDGDQRNEFQLRRGFYTPGKRRVDRSTSRLQTGPRKLSELMRSSLSVIY